MGLVLTNYLNLILSGAGVELREGDRLEKRPGRYLVRDGIGLHTMNLDVRSAGSPVLNYVPCPATLNTEHCVKYPVHEIRYSKVWMRSSRVLGVLTQCRSRNSTGFIPSILRQSGI
jgi:hypothetical protein